MDEKTKEILAHSLTASDTSILPYLPYLLQDMWQLGGDASVAIELLRPVVKATRGKPPLRVLDLACGKGAVSIPMARELGVRVTGLDIVEDFILDARRKAAEYGVETLCTFAVADANKAVETERGWDCVMLSASGNVLGKPAQMLQKLAGVVRDGGYILLDEGYAEQTDGLKWCGDDCLTLPAWEELFAAQGLVLVGRRMAGENALAENDGSDIGAIERRAAELVEKHPHLKAVFDGYVKSQWDEMDDLESEGFVSESWLLQKK